MNYRWSVVPKLLLLLLCIFLNRTPIAAQGRFLRGEVWQDYTLKDKKADFFVSTKGNDSWSGTLDVPNQAGTDGPFATVQRAQKAVRALKIATFLPKNLPSTNGISAPRIPWHRERYPHSHP